MEQDRTRRQTGRRARAAASGAAALAAVGTAALAVAGPVSAGPPRSFEVACTDGEAFTVVGQLAGNAWHVEDEKHTFVLTTLHVRGYDLVKPSPGKESNTTHACTATNAAGDHAHVTGFFTGGGGDDDGHRGKGR